MGKDDRKKQIEALVEEYYREYDFLQQEPYSMLVDKALDRFLNTNLTIDQIRAQMLDIIKQKLLAMEAHYDPEAIKDNHAMLYSKLDQLVPLLQEAGVDYHLAGSLPIYLKYGEESMRPHDDLDFMVNEKDLEKFKEIVEKVGFNYMDRRMDSPRVLKNGIPSGEHEVIATTSVSDFHIGVFCFERLVDGTFIVKGYYHDEENNSCSREEILSADLAKAAFDSEVIDYHGHPLSITAPEYIYLLKSYTKNDKDKVDIAFMENKIDQDKLKRIRDLCKTDKFVQCVRVAGLPASRTINPKAMENDNSELSQMLMETKEEKKEPKEETIEKPKQLSKVEDAPISQEGFAHKYMIVLSILMVAVLILILFLVLKWTQII